MFRIKLKILYMVMLFFVFSCSKNTEDQTTTPSVFTANTTIKVGASSINEKGRKTSIIIELDKENTGDPIAFEIEKKGSATKSTDYKITGNLTIAKGAKSTTLTLESIDDSVEETEETIELTFKTSNSNISIASSKIIVTIADDDKATVDPTDPTTPSTFVASMSTATSNVEESAGKSAITISLDKVNTGDAIAFDLMTSGTATVDQDFKITGEKSIKKDQQSVSLDLEIIDDQLMESDESIILTLSITQQNVSISTGTLTINIKDNDSSQMTCTDATDSYQIDLDVNNCKVNIQNVLGKNSSYSETENGGVRKITSNSIPNHMVGMFPNSGNPHTISEQSINYDITMNPAKANAITLLTNNGRPAYTFGILKSGIILDPIAAEYFTNTETQQDNTDWNENALSSLISLGTDCNNSHVFPTGQYHYHATPSAYISSLGIDGSAPVQIGWAADGYPVYYKYGNKSGAVAELTSSYQLKTTERGGDGKTAPSGCPDGSYTQDYEYVSGKGDLDECNGYQDPTLGYIYVVTDTYPSIPRCFSGTPNSTFSKKP